MDKFTTESVKNFETEVDYTTVLDNFEGPLDLLLYLIEKARIEIKDIFVSQVTEQFLDYMKGLPYIDLDKASEYLLIASTIINIKARRLLPVDEEDWPEDEDFGDEGSALIQALKDEYELLQQGAEKLREKETVGYYFKEPDKDFSEVQIKYKDFTLDGLVKALNDMLLKREAMERKKPISRRIPKDKFTVKEKILHIQAIIKEKDEMQFEDLFAEDATTPEIVTTFQALLELLKHQFVIVEQPELFSKITIKKNPNKGDEEIGEIDEYN